MGLKLEIPPVSGDLKFFIRLNGWNILLHIRINGLASEANSFIGPNRGDVYYNSCIHAFSICGLRTNDLFQDWKNLNILIQGLSNVFLLAVL